MAPDKSRPVALIVLDGWGYRTSTEGNAIALANTPTWDAIWSHPARTLLEASGTRVGLPEGQIGNSEVGHRCGTCGDAGSGENLGGNCRRIVLQ
jgi:2,3-bisphosphoglycerate-independent phosphoglycerate mutase